ncbi:T9SS type A sorting domain-containing protein [Aquimarina gracilis]|uniref:T9SS type A sorting domain-containing protein n=1 Tax=Aquimarina gracilis TaxID=874422 RepID=A0ABU5ZRU0_9FLAO|nr:T9SS type A sorting domain-containing protein [Aquimarina gracilis]MEB3344358.1 T9SS type A sorting domain-containing protein [Aquimarina gracilis]
MKSYTSMFIKRLHFVLCGSFIFCTVTAQTVFENVSDQIPQSVVTGTDTVDADLMDIDGDGDLDIFIVEGTTGFEGRYNRLLLNDGNGVFTDVSISNLPFLPRPANSLSSDFTDIDADGDVDIVVANLGPTQLLLNDGNGRFVDASSSRLPAPPPNILNDISTEIGFNDVNQDGRLDVFVTNEIPPIPDIGPGGAQNFLYLQNEDGTFMDASLDRLPNVKNQSASFAFGDIDGDLDEDLVIANVGQNQILINDGNGFFTSETDSRITQQNTTSRALILVDIDGDNDLDLVVANSNLEQNQVFINDSKGVFEETTQIALPIKNDTSSDVKAFDINFDGHLDLVFANSVPNPSGPATGGHPLAPAPNIVYLNNGRGVFNDASSEFLPMNNDISFDIEIGDVNGDRLDDILVSNANDGEEQLYVRGLLPPTSFNRIIPFLTCVTQKGNGVFTATFGYANFNEEAIYIPDGPRNMIVTDMDQISELPPVVFLRGIIKEAFEVTFKNGITWNLNTKRATASPFSYPCNNDGNDTYNGRREVVKDVKSYPNPFSNQTSIQFNLSQKGNIKIVLYNQFGRVVKTIANTSFNKGKHILGLDAKTLGLTPGVYFYKITAGSYDTIKSLVVM